MQTIDIILLVALFLAIIDGLRRGLLIQIIELAALIGTLVIALTWYRPLGDLLVFKYHITPLVAKPAAFLGIWVITNTATSLIVRLLYRFIPETFKGAFVNRLAGLVLALMKNAAIAGVLLSLVLLLPIPEVVKSEVTSSRIAPVLMTQTTSLTQWVEGKLGGSLADTFNFITIPNNAETHAVTEIPKVLDEHRLRVEPALEDQMLTLINKERLKENLPLLIADEETREVARAHSRDMWLRGYFSHTNPDGDDPFDRLRRAGLGYQAAGENLALAPNLTIAHQGLMRSPSHRENILHSSFGRVGIGIISAGSDGIMVTQVFRD